MSEYMFGTERRKLTLAECRRRTRICKEEGGYGYTQIDESHGTAIGGRWLGWYAAPNRGEPFDRQLAARVLARVKGPKAPVDPDIQDCLDCGHRLYLHRRHASGAYRCTSSGCGCERSER